MHIKKVKMNLQMARDPSTAVAGHPLAIRMAIVVLSGANQAVTANRSSKHLVKLPRKIATLQSWGPVVRSPMDRPLPYYSDGRHSNAPSSDSPLFLSIPSR